MRAIDLRSDTVTRPTAAMRDAMARAEVGDDVYGEDPSVNRLQELAAERVGKEAALLVPSGTMANQVALRVLAEPGSVVLAGRDAHILRYEGGAAAGLSGLHIETVGEDGFFDAEDVRAHVPPDDEHYARLAAVAIENTHNESGGRVWPLGRMRAVAEAARAHGLCLHLDGARLFNAAVAMDVSAPTLAEPFDTVSFCLSKGLGAPVGSLVCSDAGRIGRLRRVRKILGGAMRQAGFLAAAGIHALEHHVERLRDDHAHAQRLWAGLESLGLAVEGKPETNIVVFRPSPGPADAVALASALCERGVLVLPLDRRRVRAVTHLDVSEADIDEALERAAGVVRALR